MNITLPTNGRSVRPGKILCIGSNYAAHASEMKADVPDEPIVFLKPSTALIRSEQAVVLPSMSDDVHHEIELVAAIGRQGRHISVEDALGYVDGYALGLDMTARDIQSKAARNGRPWSVAKGFDTFAPLGPLKAARDIEDPGQIELVLEVNGELRQRATTGDMVFSVAEIIAYCSRIFTLEPGDLIYTGTPEGVGPVANGDRMVGASPQLDALVASVSRE